MTGVTARAAAGLILAADFASTLPGGPALAQVPSRLPGQEVPSLAPIVKQVEPAVVSIATKGTVSAPSNPLMEDPFFRRFFGFPDQQQQQQRRRQVQSAGSAVAAKAVSLVNVDLSNVLNDLALDLNTANGAVFNWLNANAANFGFRRTVPSEPWHWEYGGGGPGGGPCEAPPPPPPCDRTAGPFTFSCDGAQSGQTCVQLNEPSDPHTWGDNFLCTAANYGFRWSNAGPIDGMRILQNTWVFNAARVPAVSVPCGAGAHGLPVGLQLVGRPFREPALLAAATLVERLGNA